MKLPYPNSPVSSDIATKFNSYRTLVMNPAAPPVQVRECELAFYAGCEAMFDLLMTNAPDDETAAMKYMESLKNELLTRAQRYAQERR